MCVQSQHLSTMLLCDGKRGLAVLTAFLDESGTHAGAPVVAVAGFYGNAEQWRAFRRMWEPHSADFHAKDKSRKYPILVEAIDSSGINGILVTLGKNSYRANSTAQMISQLGNEYSLCAFECALGICRFADSPTAFVFEQGQPNFKFVMGVLLDMLDAGDTRISSVTPARKEDFIELHPADFVSHLASSHDKPWLQKLFDLHRLKHAYIEDRMLSELGPQLKQMIAKARRERQKAREKR